MNKELENRLLQELDKEANNPGQRNRELTIPHDVSLYCCYYRAKDSHAVEAQVKALFRNDESMSFVSAKDKHFDRKFKPTRIWHIQTTCTKSMEKIMQVQHVKLCTRCMKRPQYNKWLYHISVTPQTPVAK